MYAMCGCHKDSASIVISRLWLLGILVTDDVSMPTPASITAIHLQVSLVFDRCSHLQVPLT